MGKQSKSSAVDKSLSIMRGTLAQHLADRLGKPGFVELLETIASNVSPREFEAFVLEARRVIRQREDRRENGEILAAEGREKRKPKTDARTKRLCSLYKRLRPQYPMGRQGNGLTLKAVSREFGKLPEKDKAITVQAIRKALKRGGIDCR